MADLDIFHHLFFYGVCGMFVLVDGQIAVARAVHGFHHGVGRHCHDASFSGVSQYNRSCDIV